MDEVIVTGAFRFPNGDAAAARVLGIGKSLRESGVRVSYAGWEPSPRAEDLHSSGKHVYEGFDYYSQSELRTESSSIVARTAHFWRLGQRTLRWLEKRDLSRVRAIIAYHGGSRFLTGLRRLCDARGISVIPDCTEWYDHRNLGGGFFGPPHMDSELRMRFINKRFPKLLVISKYLESYYSRAGVLTLRVPPTVDFADPRWELAPRGRHDGFSLVYAGTPARKDLLKPIVDAVQVLRSEGCSVKLHLLGPTRDFVSQMVSSTHELRSLDGVISYHGRLPQEQVPAFLQKATFSVLLRPAARYSEAGFSTKLVESMSAGVPVITNRTSDIPDFVRDGEEGILVDDVTTHDVVVAIRRAIQIDSNRLQAMRGTARRTAERLFSYQSYTAALRDFVAPDK